MIASGVRLGLRDDGVDETKDVARDRAGVIQQVHPHERRDLVVAAAAGAQLAAELRPDDADERLLERAVDVFVAGDRRQRAIGDPASELIEAGMHRPLLVGGEVAGGGERLRVGVGSRDVVEREHPVEVGRTAQRGELGDGPVANRAPHRAPSLVASDLPVLTAPPY